MKHKILLFFLLFSCIAFAQKKIYFDSPFKNRTSYKTKNMRTYEVKGDSIQITDYREKKIYRKGTFYGFTKLRSLDAFIHFHVSQGYDKKIKPVLKNRSGIVTYFRSSGNPSAKIMFKNGQQKHLQVFDNKGNALLTNGSGEFIKETDSMKRKIVRIYKDSILSENYDVRIDKNDTIFHKVDKRAYPPMKLAAYYNRLTNGVDYPKFAKFIGAQKQILIKFIVTEDGTLTDFVARSNKSLHFEKNVIEELKSLPKWTPAILNGKPVKTQFIQPFTFKRK